MMNLLYRLLRLRFWLRLLRNPRTNWVALLLTLGGWLLNRNRRHR
jgi:hypothetical protein